MHTANKQPARLMPDGQLKQLQIALQIAIDNMQISIDLVNVVIEDNEQLDDEQSKEQFSSIVLPGSIHTGNRVP